MAPSVSMRGLYWNLVGRTQRTRSLIARRLQTALTLLQQRRNAGVFAVDIHARIGLFAQLNMGLRIASYCDAHGLRPYIAMTGPLYTGSAGGDIFEAYFENLALTQADQELIDSDRVRISRIEEIEHLGLPPQAFKTLTLEDANQLVQKYMRPKAFLLQEVDSWVERYFGSDPVLGLHFRGTDKSSEADPVPPPVIFGAVNRYIAEHSEVKTVFVASDEESFVEAAAHQIVGARVISHHDHLRSCNGNAVHTQLKVGDPTQKAHDALMNCLLLSRCNVLVRTASFLSAWASVFNPQLRVFMLNRPYAGSLWFPDSEIVNRAPYLLADWHSTSSQFRGAAL